MHSRISSIRLALLGVLYRAWLVGVLTTVMLSFSTAFAVRSPAKDADFTIPLVFDVLSNGVELSPIEFEYDATSEKSLDLAGIKVNDTTLSAKLLPGRKLHSRFAKSLPGEESEQLYFLFLWPEKLMSEGTIEMISRSGKVVLKFDVDKKAKEEWQKQLGVWKEAFIQSGAPKATVGDAPIFKVGFGQKIETVDKSSPFAAGKEPFRFCLTKSSEVGLSRLCTAMYEGRKMVKKDDPVLSIGRMAVNPITPRIIAFSASAELKSSVLVPPGRPMQFFAELSTGVSYEFVSEPAKLNLVEMTAEPGATDFRLMSWGALPSQTVKFLNKEEEGFFDRIGFQQTIGDLREFWEVNIPLKDPVIYLPGPSGGLFKQKIVINKLPSDSFRPYLHADTIEHTYIDGPKVFGRFAPGSSLSTKQNSISNQKGSQEFTWYFRAKTRGEMNRSYLTVRSGKNEFKAYHEVFKGYPRELSARLSGIVSSAGSLVMMGEFAFNYWFEDILGWTSYYLARHRWGISAKYFQSLSDFSLASSTATSSSNSGILKVSTVDLKYRLSPGLWNRNESWGLTGSYQNVNFLTFNSAFFGTGIFWARSMPKVFDDIFNFFRMFRYPKWVDAEFIAYYLAADSKTKVNFPNYALNFHGKVMWTNSFFGEAGFGVKQYSFQDSTTAKKLSFGSLYGTMGLGLNF